MRLLYKIKQNNLISPPAIVGGRVGAEGRPSLIEEMTQKQEWRPAVGYDGGIFYANVGFSATPTARVFVSWVDMRDNTVHPARIILDP